MNIIGNCLRKQKRQKYIQTHKKKKKKHDRKHQIFVILSKPVLQAELCQIPSSMGEIPQILLS